MTNLTVQDALSLEETAQRMRDKLIEFIPSYEIELKAELAFKINRLKKKLNAVILGHNYMEPALYHSVPDYVGDSLELSRISARTNADIIIFCGVKFMAETAKILNPSKTVLIPSLKAGCSLAEGVTVDDIHDLRHRYPGAPVVSYVNTYADVKAESDYCCTSGNAAAVIRHLIALGHDRIVFLPDEFLAHNTAKEMGLRFEFVSRRGIERPAPDGNAPVIVGWDARCEVHEKFTVDDVRNVRRQFRDVVILAHPECPPDVVAESDYAGSTKQMIDYIQRIDAPRYMLFTECSMGDNIAAENPDKEMVRMCSLRCPHMNTITLEETLKALERIQYKIELPQDIIERARLPIDRMLELR